MKCDNAFVVVIMVEIYNLGCNIINIIDHTIIIVINVTNLSLYHILCEGGHNFTATKAAPPRQNNFTATAVVCGELYYFDNHKSQYHC